MFFKTEYKNKLVKIFVPIMLSNLIAQVDTYKDELILGISSAYRNTQVLRDFLKTFADDGVPITLYSTEIME